MATRLGWVIQGLRTGIVTTTYPARPDPSAVAGLRDRPVPQPERCAAADGCTACVQVCLPNALRIDDLSSVNALASGDLPDSGTHRVLILDLGRCIGCGLCAAACPHGAMTLVTDPEGATHTRGDLVLAAAIPRSDPHAF